MSGVFPPLKILEDQFNHTAATNFMQEIWLLSFPFSAFYVVSIFSIQRYMRDKPRYNLRAPLMIWSLMLALFSVFGFSTEGVYHMRYLYQFGWERSVCDLVLVKGNFGLWSFLFCFSKFPELLDTFFIVLRKKRLIFLHWYHHITVFIYCWFSYSQITSPQQWFISMNYFVHAIMYLYYALCASGFYRPPVWVNMVITSLQLLQMAVGVWVNIFVYWNMTYTPGWFCDGKIETTYLYVGSAFLMYGSYFLLFIHFFFSNYVKKQRVEKKSPALKNTNGNSVQHGSCPFLMNGAGDAEAKKDFSANNFKLADGSAGITAANGSPQNCRKYT